MRTTHIAPTGVERTFGEDEIIVSKTDLRGIITYANDVFVRVSAYREDELLGRPHNIIRHPDMPRCVFKLLWSTVQDGREIFAYVVNLAADGAHYWVLAHVTPSFSQSGEIIGYHSSRRCPRPRAVRTIAPVYAALCKEESKYSDPVQAMAASAGLLGRTLELEGLTYEQFVWDIIAKAEDAA
ncbi:MAG TPA: PAS domain-containing protein [Acidimicrobiales bacterium]|nr:PAS domain-containing protein [Acidimicrobiales bacterium]